MLRFFLVIFFIPTCFFAQTQRQWVDSVYNAMTLDQKIGQLFMVMAFPDGDLSKKQNTTYHIKNHHVGGILFSKGTSSQQLKDTNYYQQITNTPLLVAADAEWGMAMRLQDVVPFPYAMTLGALANEDLIYALAKRIGVRKRQIGVHVSFSPVLDIQTESQNPIIGVRAFGEYPRRVTKQALSFMEGLHDAGVLAVAKHFPGHGASTSDSHKTLPKINRTREALDSIDLVPFKQLISKGLQGIMVGHLNIPALDDSGTPVSASSKVMTDLLQKQMNFEGLIFTDALDMKGITTTVKSPALSSFLAGADVLVMPLDVTKAISNIKHAYTIGKVSPKRLATSVKKILAVKFALGLHQKRPMKNDNTPLYDTYYDNYLREQIAIQSIVKVHAKSKKFPLQSSDFIHYVTLGTPLSDDFFNAIRSIAPVKQIPKQQLNTTDFSTKNLIVGVHANTSSPWSSQSLSVNDVAILKRLSATPNVHVVLFAKPYVLSQIPNLTSFASVVLAHEQQPAFAKAAKQVIFGEISASGTLPVRINN